MGTDGSGGTGADGMSDQQRAAALYDEIRDLASRRESFVVINVIGEALTSERRAVVGEVREFAEDLYGITGARWIADALTSLLDRLSEGEQP